MNVIGWGIAAAIAVSGWIVALRLHFIDERHERERNDARAQRDRLNTRNGELIADSDVRERLSSEEIAALKQANAALSLQLQEAQRPRKRRAGQAVTTGEDER